MSSIVCKSSKAFTPGQTLLSHCHRNQDPQTQNLTDPRRPVHQSVRSADILRFHCPCWIPDIGLFHDLAKITGISRQLDSQRSCAHGFRLGGIGAGMLSVVSAPDTPCLLSVIAFPADKSRPDHQQRADSRREKIHHIIQLRRGSAEVKILLILISYHRIHGIDCLI